MVFPSQQSASATLAQQQAVQQQQDLAGKKALQENDALNFLSDVNARFQHRPSVYTEFLNIMRGFKVQEMDAQTGKASTFVIAKQVN
jgi:histone deacetylase complex regulatory component SIN3